jgi:serine/threonine protein kinase/tetratricopeptide (TPR) repeat protein
MSDDPIRLPGHDKPATPPEGQPRTDDVAAGRWVHADALTTATEGPGTRLGPYKLLQQLGEGGMGTVWVAEQHQPVQRRVALKVIKPGLDSARVLARFEQERQALSLMDHPHIARILDAGSTAAGRPFFVMELVKGAAITHFCDRERLTLRQRLELFISVCQAVQHAHTKGILHRDLKPSNVLVALYDGQAVAKIIDFGLAKALHQPLTEHTLYTEVGQVVGTLEYVAPEQAERNNLDIDTRADVYSLGVLLYELLTGSPPFSAQQLRGAPLPEALRILREVEPARPSTRLSSTAQLPAIAAQRQLEPVKLTKLVCGELDWIVMKCLEKERSRRYETANGLALDVKRYLADEPVLAGPPSARYRLRKFLRKYRAPVAAVGLIALLLVAGIIGTTVGFVHAEKQRSLAEQEKARAEAAQRQAMAALAATTDDVVERLIGSKAALGASEREFLERALGRWREFAAEQGEGELARSIRAEGAFRVAKLREKLGQRDQAAAGYREAITLLEKLAAEFPAVAGYRHDLAASHNNLAALLKDLGKGSEAEEAFRRALDLREKLAGEFPAVAGYRNDLAVSHSNLGVLRAELGQRPEAEAAYRRAVDLQEKLAAEFPAEPQYRQDLATSHNNLGNLLGDLGQRPEAEAAMRRALDLQQKLAAEFPAMPQYRQDLARTHNNLAALLANLGQPPEAEAACRRALDLQQKLAAEYPAVPEYRRQLATSHNNLGLLLAELGQRPEAEAAFRRAVDLHEKLAAEFPAVPEHRTELASSHNNLAVLLAQLGKRPEAEAVLRRAVDLQEKLAAKYPAVPECRRDLALSHNNLGALLANLGKWSAAEVAHRRALDLREKLAAESPAVPGYRTDLGSSQLNFGELLRKSQQPQQALEWFGKAITTLAGVLRQVPGDVSTQRFLRNAHGGRAQTLDALQRHAAAAADWDKAVELSPPQERTSLRLSGAASRVRAGQVGPALREVEELAKNADADTLYNAACVYALASAAAPGHKDKYARRAVELLRQAVAKGYRNIEHLKQDEDLSSLRGRDDFRKLVAEIEKPSRPPPKANP